MNGETKFHVPFRVSFKHNLIHSEINSSMNIITAQKMKFSNRDFFSKYDQIPKKLNTANIATHFFELAELMFLCWILYHHIG